MSTFFAFAASAGDIGGLVLGGELSVSGSEVLVPFAVLLLAISRSFVRISINAHALPRCTWSTF